MSKTKKKPVSNDADAMLVCENCGHEHPISYVDVVDAILAEWSEGWGWGMLNDMDHFNIVDHKGEPVSPKDVVEGAHGFLLQSCPTCHHYYRTIKLMENW